VICKLFYQKEANYKTKRNKMIVNYSTKSKNDIYKLMSQTIIPRPIAWIVTKSKDGVVNVAPFSYFNGLSSFPPTLMISIGHKNETTPKDTLKNLRETKVCTICMVDEKNLDKMNKSSNALEFGVSEAKEYDIELKEIFNEFPPMVSTVKSAFFCEYYDEVDLKGSMTIPVILEIKHQFLDDTVIVDDKNIELKCDFVARVGKSYAKIGQNLTLNS
jgi:flavin reductase (DIM6/NTAB) family NADH-FMN oxidoreductase RutF